LCYWYFAKWRNMKAGIKNSVLKSAKTPFLSALVITFLVVGVIVSSRKNQSFQELNRVEESQAAVGFVETFDGFPAAPESFTQIGQSRWDVSIHSRDGYWASPNTWNSLEAMDAHHGADCAKPATDPNLGNPTLVTHRLTGRYEDYVFKCRDHVMTSMNASGYGLVALTPDHMIDFSTGEAVVKFDMSTFRSAGRDWVDVWITPFQDNIQLPFDDARLGVVDLQGSPRNAIHIDMDLAQNSFSGQVIRNKSVQNISGGGAGAYDGWLTQDAAKRDTFELRISRTHIKFGMPAYNKWWVDSNVSDLGWSQGVVQLAHHSYTPTKDCGTANKTGPDGRCRPNTWHWDNVSISPAAPFTMIKADTRYVENGQTITFSQPAPANSYLRFSGIGTIKVSLNGGAAQSVPKQPSTKTGGAEHFSNYWMSVPQGTKTVTFQIGADSYVSGSTLRAKDFAIWSLNGASSPTTVPNPTTSVTTAPTIRPSATVVATALPTPIRTSAPTPLVTPIVTTAPLITPNPSSIFVTPAPSVSSGGFLAEFYNNRFLTGDPIYTRTDPAINFYWGFGSPNRRVRSNRFSARWTKKTTFEKGNYLFAFRSDDGVRLKIDGNTVYSYWQDHAAQNTSVSIPITGGEHTVAIEYYENRGISEIRANWTKQ
jgi:hypothetical protein